MKVLHEFMEKSHDKTVYRKGDTYPKKGFEADPERVAFLQEVHPEYGVTFLEKEKKTASRKTKEKSGE